jgi:hypothetical protein
MDQKKICALVDVETAQRFEIACASDGPRGKSQTAALRELIERYLAERNA